ncbi:c-type cytochrome biogenesis protein CcsB [soil metagenome]
MEPERIVLILSSLFFLGGFGYSAFSLGAGKHRNPGFNFAVMAVGFVFQCIFLYLRGRARGQCPITNEFEFLIFISWAVVLLYFLVGQAYRISLLGTFTAPLVFLLQVTALVLPSSFEPPTMREGPADFWLELHASLSLLAYGAFALAFVAGVMFLVQDRLLKSHHLNNLFYNLPPINSLGKALVRLLALGFVLLTAGIASAYGMERSPEGVKLTLSYVIWAFYGILLLVYYLRGLSSGRLAQAAVGVFAVPLCSLWIMAPK